MSWLLAGGAVAHDLLEALIASVGDAVYMVDPDGRVRFCNPAALRILGYDDPADLVGKPSHQTIHFQHRDGSHYPAEECPMLRPRATGETVRVELDWFTRRDGRMVPVAYSSAPLATDQGRGAVVVFRDVSERLASEETARREAEERARAEELDASRARILTAMDAERRRLGRDLHDGAQQRLLHVLLLLGDGRAALDGRGGDCNEILARATAEVRAAIDDVRALAAGIHPPILTTRGLGAAIESVTARVPVPVDLDIPPDRFAEPVEIAAYYVVSEALANATKHAVGASSIQVQLEHSPGTLLVRVRDDGPGGATVVPAHGLGGLMDRLAALGGTFAVDSPLGGGTTVLATLPLH
ncbi:MAG: PAS domain S-box protein [Solirubrobacteraceae bacterium]|nr:PAS domain S-box protein [Solirubrobacteraceae bacterium]